MHGLGTYKQSDTNIKNGIWKNGQNLKIYDQNKDENLSFVNSDSTPEDEPSENISPPTNNLMPKVLGRPM